MYKDYRFINAGENEFYRWGKKAQALVASYLEPNENGFYSIPADGGNYYTIGTSEGKYGEFAKFNGVFLSVNSIGNVWAKVGTEKAEAFIAMVTRLLEDMKAKKAETAYRIPAEELEEEELEEAEMEEAEKEEESMIKKVFVVRKEKQEGRCRIEEPGVTEAIIAEAWEEERDHETTEVVGVFGEKSEAMQAFEESKKKCGTYTFLSGGRRWFSADVLVVEEYELYEDLELEEWEEGVYIDCWDFYAESINTSKEKA